MAIAPLRKKLLGEVLVSEGVVTQEQLREVTEEQEKTKEKLGHILLRKGYVSKEKLLRAMSLSLGVISVKLEDAQIDKNATAFIPEKFARRWLVMPLEVSDNTFHVAMADPSNVVVKDEIEKLVKMKLSVVLMDETEIREAIEKYYVRTSLSHEIDVDNVEEKVRLEDFSEEDILSDVDAAPVIKYVNSIFFDAVVKRASDIHLEPFEKEVSLRMRIDGVLRAFAPPQKKYYSAIISRVKIMAGLDIAERRLPQDGKCAVKVNNNKVDVRVATIPTLYGEKVVLRMLNKDLFSLDIDRIGMSEQELAYFKEAINAPYGMVLVTGPTSSGKTTTLYSALKAINTPDLNIMTAEDPVEYELKNVNQVHARPDIGLDFARILRSFMRQDPDVILVGEIRDSETAGIAVQAALTGHLVFSTLHTNDSVSTLSRMSFMGIENYLVADAVNLVIAQRLVRVICPFCKTEEKEMPKEIYERLGIPATTKLYRGTGCQRCEQTGYKGRTAIFEMLYLDREIKKLVAKGATDVFVREQAEKSGLKTLRHAAIGKLLEGVTTVEEVFAVTSVIS
ncbi:MAG: Flp pilus assembly complex ATPase component TadA [Elusimicrobia bacterium]|nr:Flp pilus assembly complex ATPase component TadA [Elusimicrobiota bacterium]